MASVPRSGAIGTALPAPSRPHFRSIQSGLHSQNRFALIIKTFPPSLYKKGHPKDTDYFQDMQGVRVPEWGQLRRGRHGGLSRSSGQVGRDRVLHHVKSDPDAPRGVPKITKAAKLKGHASGRTYTSKFRGVHQTFPTRRWEAQFRKNGKPTSLGECVSAGAGRPGLAGLAGGRAWLLLGLAR